MKILQTLETLNINSDCRVVGFCRNFLGVVKIGRILLGFVGILGFLGVYSVRLASNTAMNFVVNPTNSYKILSNPRNPTKPYKVLGYFTNPSNTLQILTTLSV